MDMRKKAILCMMMAGVLVLGCGCGKKEKKVSQDTSVVSSSEANTQDSSGSSSAETSSEEKQDSSSEKTSGTSESSSEENTGEEKTETSENSGDEKRDSSENTGEGQTDSSENSGDGQTDSTGSSAEEDKLDKDDGKTLDQIFEDCATIGEGVAGVSLKRTQQAYAVAKYAAKNRFTENDLGKLKKAFAERYEKLDSDGKESFTGAFEGEIVSLLDEAIVKGHFESVRGQFDDVGAAEKMEKILLKKGIQTSWSVIKEAYAGMQK